MIRKAARAQKFEWGLAEEIGKGARWLAAYRYPGPQLAFQFLQDNPWKPSSSQIDMESGQRWYHRSGSLCPIVVGTALSDLSESLFGQQKLQLDSVRYPLLMVAILGQSARARKAIYELCWGSVRFVCLPNGIAVEGEMNDLCSSMAREVYCNKLDRWTATQEPDTRAWPVKRLVWNQIAQLAAVTYAPSSEASRSGAGAGLTDND